MEAKGEALSRPDLGRGGIPTDRIRHLLLTAILASPLAAVAQPLSGGVAQDVFSSGGSSGRGTYPTGTQSLQPNDAPCSNPYGCGRGTGLTGAIGALGGALSGLLNGVLSGGAAGRDVYCQQSPGQPPYGPYHGTGTQTPCGLPGAQPVPAPAQGPVPNPLPWEQPAYAQNAQVSVPRSGDYLTGPFIPGGQPMRPTRRVSLQVYAPSNSATLTVPVTTSSGISNKTYNLTYKGVRLGGSYYGIVGMRPPQSMVFVERRAGALEYDVYYETEGQTGIKEETWVPAQ